MKENGFKKCPRCRGPLTSEKFYGVCEAFWGWKCLLCGEVIDPVILENRRRMRENPDVFLHQQATWSPGASVNETEGL